MRNSGPSPELSVTRRYFVPAAALGITNCARGARKTIAVIPKANADLFFVTIHTGVDRAARDLNVSVIWNGPDTETDYARQIQIVDTMIAQHVDALAISATDDRALIGPLQRVIAAGIPVSIFDSAVNIDNYVSLVATDNHGAGITAAHTLAGLVKGTGSIAMMMQKPGGTSTELRERGFEETMAREYPRINIAAKQYGMGDRARSMALAENILAANPNLSGIFCSSEACSIGAIRALRARGRAGKVRLITFDVSDIHLEAIRDGTSDVMLVQDAARIGYEAVRSLAEKLAGRVPAKRLDIEARVIRKGDLDKPDVRALLTPGLTAK